MFGKLFKGIGNVIKGAVVAVVPLAVTAIEPESLINLAAGAVLKHVVPGKAINKYIPYLSMAGSVAYDVATKASAVGIEAAVTSGIVRAAAAWVTHRSIKEPMRHVVKSPALAQKVGPGERFSL